MWAGPRRPGRSLAASPAQPGVRRRPAAPAGARGIGSEQRGPARKRRVRVRTTRPPGEPLPARPVGPRRTSSTCILRTTSHQLAVKANRSPAAAPGVAVLRCPLALRVALAAPHGAPKVPPRAPPAVFSPPFFLPPRKAVPRQIPAVLRERTRFRPRVQTWEHRPGKHEGYFEARCRTALPPSLLVPNPALSRAT